MHIKRPLIISVLLILVGVVIATIWVRLVGQESVLQGFAQVNPFYILFLLSITGVFLFARFIRWQFLLRRFDIRLPIRPNLSVYLASLAGTATPAYVGEALIRSIFMRQRFNIPYRLTIWVLGAERLLDVMVLALIGLLFANTWWLRGVMVLFLLGVGVVWVSGTIIGRRFRIPAAGLEQLQQPHIFLQTVLLSLGVWVPATLLIFVASAGLGESVSIWSSMRIFSSATLLGGLTLMPAGVASTGSATILQLQEVGLPLAQSVVVTTLVRLTSTGVVLIMSSVFLLHEFFSARESKPEEEMIHFDDIAQEYAEQFEAHIWDHLLNRKVTYITDSLPDAAAKGWGMDLGCGLGLQCLEMQKRGYRVVGLDVAQGLLRQARSSGVTVANGDALSLPFADNSLDFVFTIGVLHHLSDWPTQWIASGEVARVLKPGGRFIVHETNPRNPLFRFYMGYIFPILRSIDEGIESWIDPRRWSDMSEFQVVAVHYFTFLPDFIPEFMMKPFRALETRLEKSRFSEYSVHYAAVLEKKETAVSPASSPAKGAEVVGSMQIH